MAVMASTPADPIGIASHAFTPRRQVFPQGHKYLTDAITDCVKHFLEDDRYHLAPKYLRVYLERVRECARTQAGPPARS